MLSNSCSVNLNLSEFTLPPFKYFRRYALQNYGFQKCSVSFESSLLWKHCNSVI